MPYFLNNNKFFKIQLFIISEIAKSFPECVTILKSLGIERYRIDFVTMQKTYYSKTDETYVYPLNIENLSAPGLQFNADKIVEYIHSIQQNKIDYDAFVRGIIANGTSCYTTYLDGCKVIYFGRKGEIHTESFPWIL